MRYPQLFTFHIRLLPTNAGKTFVVDNIGGTHVPVVIADLSKLAHITPESLQSVGYTYNTATDKWNISDAAADYIFSGHALVDFELPGTLKVLVYPAIWNLAKDKTKYFPIFNGSGYLHGSWKSSTLNFVMIDCFNDETALNDFTYLAELSNDPTVVICLSSTNQHAMPSVRRMFLELMNRDIKTR